ncbi:hypothetical protein HDV06_002349 [Boothiomyces sp. JEL0866]|nr:hypothetical protein HDV06_002349 [Boothiomyces sp. JEL0866]
MKRKRQFGKDIRALMYGFGDDPNPLPETIDCEQAQKKSTTPKLKTSDFLAALENDPKKLARAHELLNLDKELKLARATFGDAVQVEMASNMN